MESFGSREIFRPTWSTSRGAPFCPFRPVVRPKLALSISKNSPFQLRSYQNLDRDEIESFDPVGNFVSIEQCRSIFSWFLASPAGREHAYGASGEAQGMRTGGSEEKRTTARGLGSG